MRSRADTRSELLAIKQNILDKLHEIQNLLGPVRINQNLYDLSKGGNEIG